MARRCGTSSFCAIIPLLLGPHAANYLSALGWLGSGSLVTPQREHLTGPQVSGHLVLLNIEQGVHRVTLVASGDPRTGASRPRRDRVWVVAGSWEAENARARAGFRVTQRSVLAEPAVVATPRSRSTADGRGAGHRLRPLQPTRQGLPHRQDRRAHQLRQRRHPGHDPPVYPRGPQRQSGPGGAASAASQPASTPPRSDRPRLAARPEALDRADPRHAPAGTPAENIAAADVELTADDLREIEDAASQITVLGARYPEHLERLTGR